METKSGIVTDIRFSETLSYYSQLIIEVNVSDLSYWSFAEKTFVKQSMMLCAFEILLKIGRFGGGKSYRRFGGKSYLAI